MATALQIADPSRIAVDIYRLDPGESRYAVVIRGEFLVKADARQAAAGGDEAAQAVRVTGSIRRFLPDEGEERLQIGDRFDIPEIGGAVIDSIHPDSFGVERAQWIAEEGAV